MKIKYISLFLSLVILGVFAEDCSYLKVKDQSLVKMDYEWSYNNTYPYELCKLNSPIHEEAIEYIQGIKDTEGKDVRELMTDVGNVFCRGYFWECGKDSFYGRFKANCKSAREKTAEQLKDKQKSETISADFIAYSFNGCEALAETYMKPYKEVAISEVGRYHKKQIEKSSKTYMDPSAEKMWTLGGTWDTFIKIFGNIARSIQGLTQEVFM